MGAVTASAPTVGSNHEIYDYKGVRFGLIDIGGQTSLRASWSQYFKETEAIILVIDSSDTARLGLAKAELQKLVSDEVSLQALGPAGALQSDAQITLTNYRG
jgi:ADP-ribosylation factor-like protein 5B